MLAIEQHERFAVEFWNLFERAPKNGFLLTADDGLHGHWFTRCGVGDVLQRLGNARRFALAAAHRIVHEIARDSAKPGAKFHRFAQTAQLRPGRKKRFLREVLTLGETAGRAVSNGANEILVAFDDVT